jgi:hypothetical protein
MKNEVLRNVVIKMRKTLALMSILMLLGAGGAYAQVTMGIGSSTAKVGDTVNVPINVTNFTNIGAISIKLGYTSAATKFVGITGAPAGVTFTSNADAVNNVITLGWFDATASTPINLGTGVLVNIRVVYTGGTGAFTFNGPLSEIANSAGTAVPVTYLSGSVSPIALGMTIGAAQGTMNSTVTVPINVTNFTSVGAVSLKIQYDPAVVQFDSVANAPASMSFTKGTANGVITLGWFDATGNSPVTIAAGGKLLDLKFTYKGGASALTFVGGQSEIASGTGGAFTVQYTNGQVTPAPGQALTLNLPDVTLMAGSSTVIPLTVDKFSAVGAISMKIQYNAAVLTFNNISNPAVSGITTNASNGVLTIAWFDATGNTPLTVGTTGSGKLADLNFTYNGGSSSMTFIDAQTEISNGSGVKIPATYKNGSISQSVKPVMTQIAAISKKEQDTVSIVVSATDANPADVLTYSASSLPTGATFATATHTFLWVPALNTAGVYTVKFFVTNGLLTDSTTAVITIAKNNLKPVFVNKTPAKLDSVKLNLGYKIAFKVTASDPNKDSITYTWKLNQAVKQTGKDSTYQLGAITTAGPQTLVCVFADNGGLSDSVVWNFYAASGVTRVNPVNGVPVEFSLGQNYPNPFNPSTTIKFALPMSTPVTLEVYNILGAKVRTLINGTIMSAANHEVVWDGKNDVGAQVASGMYLYRIATDKHVATMKMMLMK